ncbi:MAG: VanW family protein [Firmicutes bacterium]|nr:VanW family protein [Bacillota bacterium]
MRKRIFLLIIKGTSLSLIVLFILTGCLALGIRDSYKRLKYGVPRGVYLIDIPLEKKLPQEVRAHVLSLAQSSFIRPRNAFLDPLSGQMLPPVYGRKIDVEATIELVMNSEPGSVLQPVYIPLDPEITMDLYQNIRHKRGSFATGYGDGGRGKNIRLAAGQINNYVLASGEIFSFNKATMPRDAEHGYELAPIIVGDAVVPGYGGGVCQVSTTLYNAVRRAGLEIVERYPHSLPIDYVAPGMDATVSDYLDFKFRNDTEKMIMIKATAHGYLLVVEIWE